MLEKVHLKPEKQVPLIVYPTSSLGLFYIEGKDVTRQNIAICDESRNVIEGEIIPYNNSLIVDIIDKPAGIYYLINKERNYSIRIIKFDK